MKILYPDAKHDRYGHSIGVYHLGLKAVDALLENFKVERHWNIRSDNLCSNFWAKNKVLFLIACLLHDIGHAPFSHSLEELILYNSKCDQTLADEINQLEKLSDSTQDVALVATKIKASAHEKIGARLIIEHFKDPIEKILRQLNELGYPIQTEINYAEYAKSSPHIDFTEIDSDICFIARMVLGLKYESFEPEKQIKNCFIELLNGQDFDVDKLDYIIRDTKMSGISNVTVDVERLIGSLTLVTTTKYKGASFNESNCNFRNGIFIKELKTEIDNSIEIDGNIDAKFILFGGTELTIFNGGEFLSLRVPSDVSDEIRNKSKIELISKVDFHKQTQIYRDGREVPIPPNSDDRETITWADTEDAHSVIIKNAKIVGNSNFKFKITNGGTLELEIKGDCKLQIKGKVNTYSAKLLGTIIGNVEEMTVVDDLLQKQEHIPSPSIYNVFSIGYKKQAINIISNVLDARDYLYLWVYAHHKVIYYANFLLPFLSSILSSRFIKSDSFPSWNLNYDNIMRLDDAYMMTAMKYVAQYHEHDISDTEKRLFRELFSRKYKKSLYKSLAEYDIFFADFTIAERQKIRNHFATISSSTEVRPEYLTFGFVPDTEIKKMSEISDLDLSFLKDMVWVDASYKQKKMDFRQIYCIFQDEKVTMERLDLLSKQAPVTNNSTKHYFYLYYEIDCKESRKDTADVIKKALHIYLKSNV
jgi:HD superfamily phosphohydrolases